MSSLSYSAASGGVYRGSFAASPLRATSDEPIERIPSRPSSDAFPSAIRKMTSGFSERWTNPASRSERRPAARSTARSTTVDFGNPRSNADESGAPAYANATQYPSSATSQSTGSPRPRILDRVSALTARSSVRSSASRESPAMGGTWTTTRWPVARDRPSKNSDTPVLHRTGPSSQRSFSPLIRLQAKRPSLAKGSQSGRSDRRGDLFSPAPGTSHHPVGGLAPRYENTR